MPYLVTNKLVRQENMGVGQDHVPVTSGRVQRALRQSRPAPELLCDLAA